MADCTKTVEFIRELTRMCSNFKACSYGCPLYNVESDSPMCDPGGLNDGAIPHVQKWSDEHPVTTWQGKMQQLLPKANVVALRSGILVCPSDVFGEGAPCWRNGCNRECAECWNSEYREDNHG